MEGENVEVDVDKGYYMETVCCTLVDVVPTCIPNGCMGYQETVTTAPFRELRSISRMPRSMYPSTGDPRLSKLESLLRCCTVLYNWRAKIMLSLHAFKHVRKRAWP